MYFFLASKTRGIVKVLTYLHSSGSGHGHWLAGSGGWWAPTYFDTNLFPLGQSLHAHFSL